MWEQPKSKEAMPITQDILLWSPRGRLCKINTVADAKKLFSLKWKVPTQEEVMRFKVGDYYPIYDLGEEAAKTAAINIIVKSEKLANVLYVIEV